jgi:4-hydroxybenzoate polyprenyltransferase
VAKISQKLLPVLQLTRMALVSTALADSGCGLMLWANQQAHINNRALWRNLDPVQCMALALVSIGLYGFGMSLNDIIDHRRDRQISPHRPLPSGRIGVGTAHIVCALLVLLALVGGDIYSSVVVNTHLSLVLVVFTAALISFYDFAAKYLAPLGLLSLGLIRFFHATIAAPTLPVIWQPLLLMNHITIVSTVAYHWEHKRPILRPVHWASVFLGLGALDGVAIGLVYLKRSHQPALWPHGVLSVQPALLGPALAVLVFFCLAVWIKERSTNSRIAGQALSLAGLLWLIVYDASFVVGYVGIPEGIMVLMFLPVAYVSVLIMRWWSKMMLLSQRPTFRRVEA